MFKPLESLSNAEKSYFCIFRRQIFQYIWETQFFSAVTSKLDNNTFVTANATKTPILSTTSAYYLYPETKH